MTISPVRPDIEGAPGNRIGRHPILALSLAAAAFVALCVAIWPPTDDPYDLQVYVVAAKAVLEGRDIYTAHAGNPILLGFTYPPFAALLFSPLGALSAGVGRFVMSALSAISVLTIATVTLRAVRPRWSTHRVLAGGIALAVAGLALEPVRMTFHYGQINLMLLALLMVDLFGHLPRRFRGALIGIATGIKLTPGIFIIYLLVTRRYREAITASVATAATMLIGFVAMPTATIQFWTKYVVDPTRPGPSALVSNQALRGVIDRLSGGPQGLGPVWTIAVAITVVLGFLTVRRAYDRGYRVESILLTAAIGLLVSPISWTAHWVWALPACALLWTRATTVYRIALAVLTTLTFGIGLPWLAPYMDDRELHHHGYQLFLGNSYAICAVVLLGTAAYFFSKRRSSAILVLTATILPALCLLRWHPWSARMDDLGIYYAAARGLVNGQDIYTSHLTYYPDIGLGFTYPPFAALVFSPFAIGLPFARTLITLASAVALLAIGWATAKKLHWSPRAGVLFAFVALLFEPVQSTFRLGQINLVLMAMLMVDLLGLIPRRYRGILVGVATGIKLTPGIFIVFLLITKRYREALIASVTTALTMVFAFLVAPNSTIDFWTKYIFDPGRVGPPHYISNQSIRGAIVRITENSPVTGPLWLLPAMIVAVAGLYVARRLYERGLGFEAVVVTAFTGLAVSPISWTNHWVWALPAAALAWHHRGKLFSARTAFSAVWIAVFLAGLPRWLPFGGDREFDYSGLQTLVADSYLLCALALIIFSQALNSEARTR